MGAHPRVPGTSTPARMGGREMGIGAGGGEVEPRYPLPCAPRGAGEEMLGALRNQHFVVTRGGQGCLTACCPPGPTREHQSSRPRGAHGHAVQTADTSTARGAEGGHGGGEVPAGTQRDGAGWGGGKQGVGSSGWEGRVGGGTHTRTGTMHRFLRPRVRLCSERDGDGASRGMERGHSSPGWGSPLAGQNLGQPGL